MTKLADLVRLFEKTYYRPHFLEERVLEEAAVVVEVVVEVQRMDLRLVDYPRLRFESKFGLKISLASV